MRAGIGRPLRWNNIRAVRRGSAPKAGARLSALSAIAGMPKAATDPAADGRRKELHVIGGVFDPVPPARSPYRATQSGWRRRNSSVTLTAMASLRSRRRWRAMATRSASGRSIWASAYRRRQRSRALHARPRRAMSALPRFVALYALMYGAFGVSSPFMPAVFEGRGLGPEQVGILLGAGTAIRLIAGPLVGRVADRSGASRRSRNLRADCRGGGAGSAVRSGLDAALADQPRSRSGARPNHDARRCARRSAPRSLGVAGRGSSTAGYAEPGSPSSSSGRSSAASSRFLGVLASPSISQAVLLVAASGIATLLPLGERMNRRADQGPAARRCSGPPRHVHLSASHARVGSRAGQPCDARYLRRHSLDSAGIIRPVASASGLCR